LQQQQNFLLTLNTFRPMKKVWTAEEDQVIITAVKDCSEKLTTAFIASSFMLDRTPEACKSRYYKKLKSKTQKQNWKTKLSNFIKHLL